MTSREAYEAHQRLAAEAGIKIRHQLSENFNELADRAVLERRFEAASAFQLAAALARGMTFTVGEARPSKGTK